MFSNLTAAVKYWYGRDSRYYYRDVTGGERFMGRYGLYFVALHMLITLLLLLSGHKYGERVAATWFWNPIIGGLLFHGMLSLVKDINYDFGYSWWVYRHRRPIGDVLFFVGLVPVIFLWNQLGILDSYLHEGRTVVSMVFGLHKIAGREFGHDLLCIIVFGGLAIFFAALNAIHNWKNPRSLML